MKFLLLISLIITAAITLSACEKNPFEFPVKMCVNGLNGQEGVPDFPSEPSYEDNEQFKKEHNGRSPKLSPYTKLVFRDEFNGPNEDPDRADYPGCYDIAPTCSVRLDLSKEGPCFGDTSHLTQLNKCKWEVWSGYSFWDNTGKLSYIPSQVDVRNGVLSFKIKDQSAAPGLDCGPVDAEEHWTLDRWKYNCPVVSGGVDSKYRNGNMKGRNIKKGRVDIRAAVPGDSAGNPYPNTWPALWSWGSDVDAPAHPYPGPTADRAFVGEYDILEAVAQYGKSTVPAYQTYHTWGRAFGDGRSGHTSTGSRFDLNLIPSQYETFGMERYKNYLLYYQGNCYTRKVVDGDPEGKDLQAWEKRGGTIQVDGNSPIYLTLGMGLDGSFVNHPYRDIDGAEFKVDYVRVYEDPFETQ